MVSRADQAFTNAQQNRTKEHTPIRWQSARELQQETIPPLRWCIRRLIPEGLFVLAGRPKRGKSMLGLNLAIAKATGSLALKEFPVDEAGDVAYLALEDGKRRIKYRIEQLMPTDALWPERLHIAYQSPRTDAGLTEELTVWAESVKEPALVIVDILARVTPSVAPKGNVYDAEYHVLAALMDWASQRQIALGVITHTTKAKAEDVFETVMSTTANTGATATNMLLVRHAEDPEAVLHLEGKDMAPQALALRCGDGFNWEYVGNAEDLQMSKERRELLEALYESKDQAATRLALVAMLGTNTNALNRRIMRARELGYVLLRDGKVALTDKAAVLLAEDHVRDTQSPL